MTTCPSPTFSPSPDAVDGLLHALARPDISFLDLAAAHKTTPEALTLWMTRPAIRERLAAAADLVTWRTQFAASHVLDTALTVLRDICKSFSAPDKAIAPAEVPSPSAAAATPPQSATAQPSPDPERAALLRARRTETARRAATTILRLTHIRSIGAPPAPRIAKPEAASAPTPLSIPTQPAPTQPPRPSPLPSSASGANPNRHPNPNRPLPRPSPRPLSPISSLLDLVGTSSVPTALTFSPRDPFP